MLWIQLNETIKFIINIIETLGRLFLVKGIRIKVKVVDV